MIERPKINVGIDIALNSTGISFLHVQSNKVELHRLTSYEVKNTKKKIRRNSWCKYHLFNRLPKSSIYGNFELNKIKDGVKIAEAIFQIILNYKNENFPNENIHLDIRFEGPVYSSFGGGKDRIIDLVAISAVVKAKFFDYQSEYLTLWMVSPNGLKKSFTGNGRANKGMMIDRFVEIYRNSNIKDIEIYWDDKIDDIVDAFGLSNHIEPWDIDKIPAYSLKPMKFRIFE